MAWLSGLFISLVPNHSISDALVTVILKEIRFQAKEEEGRKCTRQDFRFQGLGLAMFDKFWWIFEFQSPRPALDAVLWRRATVAKTVFGRA